MRLSLSHRRLSSKRVRGIPITTELSVMELRAARDFFFCTK
jgi:hypothetical protein